jgi:hypothetical protein
MRKLIIAAVMAAALAVPSAASAGTGNAAPCAEPLAECVQRLCEQALSNCPVGAIDRICDALADCPIDDVQGFCRRALDNCPLAAAPATRSATPAGAGAGAGAACRPGEPLAACATRIVRESLTCAGSCVPGCSEPLTYCAADKLREICNRIFSYCS